MSIPQRTNIFNLFLTVPNCAIKLKVIEKRIYSRSRIWTRNSSPCNFFEPEKAMDWAEKDVKKLVWKEEPRILPSNNLRENI